MAREPRQHADKIASEMAENLVWHCSSVGPRPGDIDPARLFVITEHSRSSIGDDTLAAWGLAIVAGTGAHEVVVQATEMSYWRSKPGSPPTGTQTAGTKGWCPSWHYACSDRMTASVHVFATHRYQKASRTISMSSCGMSAIAR